METTAPTVSKVCPVCRTKVSAWFYWRPGSNGQELHTQIFAGNCTHCEIGAEKNGEPKLVFEEPKPCQCR